MRNACALIVAMLVVSCAGLLPRTMPSEARVDTGALRVRDGACVQATAAAGALLPTKIVTCATSGMPGMLHDDGVIPLVHSHFSSRTFGFANPGSWQLTIWRDNQQILQTMLKDDVPSVGVCDENDCEKYDVTITELPKIWEPGKYTFQYICSFDTSARATMSLTIADAAPSATSLSATSAIAPSAPAQKQ